MKTSLKTRLGSLIRQPRRLLTLLLPLALFLGGWWFGLPAEKKEASSVSEQSDEIWTCSMHPQIRQPNFGLCPICEMDLIPLQDDGGGGIREVAVSPEAAALLDLRVSPVLRTTAQAEVSLFGKIAYDERRISSITSRIGGRIDRLFVDFTGALVRKNDHLAEIYSPEIYVAQRELIEASKAIRKQSANSSQPARQTRQRLLSAAREKLRLLQLSEDQIDDIALQSEPSDRITIRSPQDGIVLSKSVDQGQYVKTGERLFQVADLAQVWLELEAYESDLPWLRYAQDVNFTVEALPGENFHGRVAFIDPEINPVTRITKIRINVENPQKLLKPGMFARAGVKAKITGDGRVLDPILAGKWISPMHPEIMKDEPGHCDICGMALVPASELGFISKVSSEGANQSLLVPVSAVLRTGERAIVYVRLPEKVDPTFEGREIILGPKVGKQYVVESGLSEGELVVTNGAFKLDSELQIKAKPSMMNPNAGLEERPANAAPKDLAGQWQPVLRVLARFQQAARSSDKTAGANALNGMKKAILGVDQSTFQPNTENLWREFSNRLLNAIALTERTLASDPLKASGILTRATREAGRYLGLPSETTLPAKADPALVKSLKHLLGYYLPVAKALADDQAAVAQTAAKAFATHAKMLPLAAEAEQLQQDARSLSQATEIEIQRGHFQKISDRLIALIRAHALDQIGSAYVVHCPMAFDGKGGDWLSNMPEVLNPYFGDAMLMCGSVTATLSLGDDPPKEKTMKDMNHSQHGK